jgi:hypothetical protein
MTKPTRREGQGETEANFLPKKSRYVGTDTRITMTRTSVNSVAVKWIKSGSGYGPVVGTCEHGNGT